MRVSRRAYLASLVAAGLIAGACAGAAPPAGAPTPAIVPRVTTPFPAFAAAAPPAQLFDRPGGTPGRVLPRGTDLRVEDAGIGPDGGLWYRVAGSDGIAGWLAGASLSLVDDATPPTPTALATVPPRATVTPGASPTPRPLVVTGSGSGLFLRVEPGRGEIVRSYPDGTTVTPLGQERTVEGRRWLRVRATDGREGWMAAEYLRPGS